MKKLLLLIVLLPVMAFGQVDSLWQDNKLKAQQIELLQTGFLTMDSVMTDTSLMFVLYNNQDMDVKTDTCIVIKRAEKAKMSSINNTLYPQWYVWQVFHLRSKQQIPNEYIWNFKEVKL